MSTVFSIPETKVLAIASHVVYGYVGNTMATLVMQSLGCDVAAMNTVHFSNHTGYRQFRGRRHPSVELDDLYAGLKQSHLTDFDMLLTGYAPSAEAISSIGKIGTDLQQRSAGKPGSFFWVLDPVMGDQGRLYVSEDVVPMYRSLVGHADLIVPNQFEAETLSQEPITGLHSLAKAVEVLHQRYGIPHVVVTSVVFTETERMPGKIAVVGSSKRSNGGTRMFVIHVPKLDCFFSGTGDMFAALLVVRLREAAIAAGLLDTASWMSGDEVTATELPLARAVEMVLASMGGVLEKTVEARNAEMSKLNAKDDVEGKEKYLAQTKAAEVRVVRNVEMLKSPVVAYRAQQMEKL